MWKDPIVEEIHRYRAAYAKQFNYDMRAISEDIKAKEMKKMKTGWKMVSSPKEIRSEEINHQFPNFPHILLMRVIIHRFRWKSNSSC
jgi:hypothetical protein